MLTLPRLIEAQARHRPKALAVSQQGRGLSYQELNAHANVLAHRLRGLGVRQEVPVAVCMQRSVEFLVCLLAIWKAGGTALLLDPEWPDSRVTNIVAAVRPLLLLTATGGSGPAGLPVATVELLGEPGQPRMAEGVIPLHLDNLAYHVMTTGSTGEPKVVGVTHRAVAHRAATHRDGQRIVPSDRSSWLCAPASSVAAVELWPYLAAGASVHVAGPDLAASPAELRDWLIDARITKCFVNTATAEQLFEQAWPPDAPLELMTVGGEGARRWASSTLPFEVANSYGSAEANGVTSCLVPWDRRCTSATAASPDRTAPPPIGRPWPDVQALILDDHLYPVAGAGRGELYIASPELARGYLGRPALTAERFLPNPHGRTPGERLYRTGDLVCLQRGGLLQHHCRTDDHVKVSGYLVDPGEVEVALAGHRSVAAAAVVGVTGRDGVQRLTAHVVPDHAAGRPSVAGLRELLAARLPGYMVPSTIRFLAELPLNSNGKVDRKALADAAGPEPAASADRAEGDEVAQGVLEIWTHTVAGPIPGLTDDFHAVGGDSLAAGRLIASIRETFNVQLRMRDFLRRPTPGALIDQVRALSLARDDDPRQR
jgi:amino acid adenylation domain-containing protein